MKRLLSDPKEIAEHLMLLDLGRNDIVELPSLEQLRLLTKCILNISHMYAYCFKYEGKIKKKIVQMFYLVAFLLEQLQVLPK